MFEKPRSFTHYFAGITEASGIDCASMNRWKCSVRFTSRVGILFPIDAIQPGLAIFANGSLPGQSIYNWR
jgi:hypothetical protein